MVFQRETDGKEQASVEVVCGERRQRLSVVSRAEEATLLLSEGGVKMRSWPLHAVRVNADQPGGAITIEAGGETLTFSCSDEVARRELSRAAAAVLAAESGRPLADAALEVLLEDAAPDDADAELWVKRLAERLAKLDALNVGGMLAAATEGGGAQLSARLEAGVDCGQALSSRLARYEAVRKGAAATVARGGAARADRNARALLTELDEIFKWLDAPALADLESLSQINLGTSEGRARALAACAALRSASRAAAAAPTARKRLAAVRDRLRRLHKAREHLAASLSRYLNNLLIHVGNEALEASEGRRRHADLRPCAPFMRCLREIDERPYQALVKVYVSSWSRVYEREVRAACDAAKAAVSAASPDKHDEILDQVLTQVETLCNTEQDFCTQFFCLDVDFKSEASDGERSEKSDPGERSAELKRVGADTRRLMGDLFPTAEAELVGLVGHVERADTYGAMRALACVSRRVLGDQTPEGSTPGTPGSSSTTNPGPPGTTNPPGTSSGEGRWARAALAAVAVAAKRGADKIVADRIAAMPDAVKQASRKQKCGILPFVRDFEQLSQACGTIFATARRADHERWYAALCAAMLDHIQHAEHPRTPRAMIQTENYHHLHGVISSLRVAALDGAKRSSRARYEDALRMYVTQYFGRPLEKLTQFFEGVSEAVAGGTREEEVCFRSAYSKHELRRVLALYPAHEVRKSMHRLYKTVEKHVSAESGGLLQVVWRAMQQEFIAQHVALETRIAACYPGAGLSLPLTTKDILDAFSDIAREH